MITIPPPQPPQNVQKIQVSSKDPHHQLDKDKDKNKKEKHKERSDDVEDKITLSEHVESKEKNPHPQKKPDSPMQGHINIDA